MQRHLLTPSLHSSWFFFHKMETKTKQDFLDTLMKKPIVQTEAMLSGIKFENDVMAFNGTKVQETWAEEKQQYKDCVAEIASIVRGGLWQERVYSDTSLCGMNFLLYGKADVIKRDTIYDIKFTANYDTGKFSCSVQHLLYMHCSGLPKFKYLITDGKNVWTEDYFLDENTLPKLRGELSNMIENIMADEEFKAAYLANWGTYADRNANAA